MPVTRADKWANTALLAMLRGGVDVGGVNFGLIADTMKNDGAPKIDPNGRYVGNCACIHAGRLGGVLSKSVKIYLSN